MSKAPHLARLDKETTVDKLVAEIEQLKKAHWADLNNARNILNSRIQDLVALAEDFQLKELEIKKALKETNGKEHKQSG